jgi:hypothetical protein
MHWHSIDDSNHSHVFRGEAHKKNERKVGAVFGICRRRSRSSAANGSIRPR